MEDLGCSIPITAGTIFYTVINLVCRFIFEAPMHMDRKERHDYYGQHVSLIHSIEAISLCIVSYIYSNGIDYTAPTDYLQVWTLGFSLGYFVYDFFYAEIYKLHDWPMRIHHLFVIAGGVTLLLQDEAGALGPLCLFLTELSNPFLELRLILKGKKKQGTSLYKFVEYSFAVVFILNRGGLGTIINYDVYQYDLPWLLKFMVSGVYGVSLYWIYVIISMLLKTDNNKSDGNCLQKCSQGTLRCLRKNQILFGVGISLWCLILPITLRALGCPPIHAESGGFKII